MAGSLASINIKFKADLSGFSTEVQNASRQLEGVGKSMQKVGAAMSLAITAPVGILATKATQLFDVQAKAVAQVEAGLRSTGNAVGYTSKQLQDMASGLQNNSLFGDEEILKGVTSQLLTFTNIANEQFDRTQLAALDLATRLDGDLKSSAIQLGKALNDPKANLSALSRSGIQFSESQKTVINALQESGRLAEAQTIILDELEKQYGGSAKAAAEAGTGGIKQLSNSWGDLLEMFGEIIANGIKPLVGWLKGLVQSMQELSPETKKVIVIVAGLAAAIGPLTLIIGTVLTLIPTMVAGFAAVKGAILAVTAVIAANPFGAIAAAIGLVVSAFFIFNSASKETENRLKSVGSQTKLLGEINLQASASVSKGVKEVKSSIDPLIAIIKNENNSLEVRKKAYQDLIKISPEFIGTLDGQYNATERLTAAYSRLLVNLQNKLKAEAKAAVVKKYYDEEAAAIDNVYKSQLEYLKLKKEYLAYSEYNKKYSKEAKELYDRLTVATDNYRAAITNEKIATKNIAEVEKFRQSELQKLINEQSKYTKNSKEWLELQTQIDTLLGLSSDGVKKLTGNYNGLNDAIKQLPKAGTIAFYEAEISKLQKLQKEATLTQREYIGLQQRIEEFQSKITDISAPIVSVQDTITMPEVDSESFKESLLKNSEYYKNMVAQIGLEGERLKATQEATNAAMKAKAEELNEAYGMIGDSFTNLFQSYANGFVDSLGIANEGMKAFVQGLVSTITKLIAMALSASMANSIQGATQTGTATGPAAAFSTPAFIATAIAGILSAFAAIPKFATGGVVNGSSFYGDKILARVNSGELILNDRQQRRLFGMMDNGSSGVAVELALGTKISGSDIELIVERAIRKNSRKR